MEPLIVRDNLKKQAVDWIARLKLELPGDDLLNRLEGDLLAIWLAEDFFPRKEEVRPVTRLIKAIADVRTLTPSQRTRKRERAAKKLAESSESVSRILRRH